MDVMNIKSLIVSITLTFGALSSSLLSTSATADIVLTPQWTERYLFKHYPFLLKNTYTDHVLAFYYFGGYKNFTMMGMERVKGEDYTAYNTVLIFENSKLQGYYQNLAVFPAAINEQGIVKFPANNDVISDIDLEKRIYPDIVFQREKKMYPAQHSISEFTLVEPAE